MSQPRQPKGVATGGQWRPTARKEGSVRLTERGGTERTVRIQAADPAKTLERVTERLHFTQRALAQVTADETLSPEARAALAEVCAQRLRGLRAAYTRAFRQLAGAGPRPEPVLAPPGLIEGMSTDARRQPRLPRSVPAGDHLVPRNGDI